MLQANENRVPEYITEPDFGGCEWAWFLPRYLEYATAGTLPVAGGYDDQPAGWWVAVRTIRAMLARVEWERRNPEAAQLHRDAQVRQQAANEALRQAPGLGHWMHGKQS